jgi:hypothetical protein
MVQDVIKAKEVAIFYFSRLLSGQSLAAQKPGESEVFWLLFFKKVTSFLWQVKRWSALRATQPTWAGGR